MIDIQSVPDCGRAKLVVLACWEYSGKSYWAFTRCFQDRYFFEGRWRIKNGRHTYFPKDNWQCIEIGNKKECLEFLDTLFKQYECPPGELKDTLEKVEKWRII